MSYPAIGNLIGWLLSKTLYRQTQETTMWKTIYAKKLIPGWAIGQTWGEYIFLKAGMGYDSSRQIIGHESVHVEQWRRYGFWGFGFAIRYLYELIVRGYENNRLEVEARERSK